MIGADAIKIRDQNLRSGMFVLHHAVGVRNQPRLTMQLFGRAIGVPGEIVQVIDK
jgi:hypothetical protein